MSDTPRTDARKVEVWDGQIMELVPAYFARLLELEIKELTRQLETVKKILVAVENQRNELMRVNADLCHDIDKAMANHSADLN